MKVTTVISIFTAVAAAAVTGQDMRNKNNEDMVARDVQMQEAEQANAPKMATTPLVLPIPTSIPSFSKPVPTILPSKTLPMTAPTSTMKPSSNGSNAASLGPLITIVQGLITDVTKSIPQLKDAGAKANAALDAFISAAKDLKPATTSKPSTTSKPATTKTTTTPKATLT